MKGRISAIRTGAIGGFVLSQSTAAYAGMPSVTFNDIASMRLSAISFFLVCFLICSWLVRSIWNAARKDFPRLPYLSFKRATGLVAIWGLLFLLVLTMISGARELMTPGAWRKEGLTYKLTEETGNRPDVIQQEPERRDALARLRVALLTYAAGHGGKLPASRSTPEIPEEVWIVPGHSGMKYLYNPGLSAGRLGVPVAYEPVSSGRNGLCHEKHGSLPPAATFDRIGRALHGWQAAILPFAEQGELNERIDFRVPWPEQRNAPAYQTLVPTYLFPGIEQTKNEAGYALSHYAGNVAVMGGDRARTLSDVPDGASFTIMAGEVASEFKPWGDPTNWRDPALGTNKTPAGFGSRSQRGADFLMVDGSVRFVKDTTDPRVFKALSTPSGGEKIGEGQY
jgi:Protein of unknown function (DUF1559)